MNTQDYLLVNKIIDILDNASMQVGSKDLSKLCVEARYFVELLHINHDNGKTAKSNVVFLDLLRTS